MSGFVAGAVAIGSIAGGYLGAEGAKDAAKTSAAASDRAAELSNQQYMQSRQDLQPYRDVAVGQEIYGIDEDAYAAARKADMEWQMERRNLTAKHGYDKANSMMPPRPVTNRESFQTDEVTGYTGGALNTLAEYGRSREDPNSYIPESDIPQYDNYVNNLPRINSNIPQFDVGGAPPEWNSRGNIPEFDVTGNQPGFDVQGNIPDFNVQGNQPEYSQLTDITQDPSYQFRKEEQERAINRNMAGMGKTMSGNRLEELMARGGDLASQEYAAADARNVRDYDINREREDAGYGRDLTAYGEARANEAARYNRGVGEYDINRLAEQEGYGRNLTGYDVNRLNESTAYGRERSIFDTGYQREGDVYSRGLTAYDASRQNEALGYGRDVDAYNRDYSLNVDRYNAATGAENLGYGRGVDAYGRAYGQEGEYLNRLANLSAIGQTATNTGVQAGSYAANAGGAAIQNSGNALAAGQIGQASAWQGALGDLTALGTSYAMRQQQPYNYQTAPGYGGTPIYGTDYYGR